MYNSTQKNEYLNDVAERGDKYMNVVKTLFRKISDIERDLDLDFCQFERKDVIDTISKISGRKNATILSNITILRGYVVWCVFHGLCEDNNLIDISVKDIDVSNVIRYESLSNIDHLRCFVDVVLTELNDEVSMNTIYKLFIFLLYSGVKEQELIDLEIDDIIIEGNLLKYSDKQIYLHDFIIPILKRVMSADKVVWRIKDIIFYKKLMQSNKLIGAVVNIDGRQATIKTLISKLNKEYYNKTGKYIRLSTNRIYESGVYYRLLQQELDNKEIDENYIKYSFDIYRENYSTHNIYLGRIANIKKDYEAWKKAWNYI